MAEAARPRPERRLPRPPGAVTFDCWQTLIYEADWELAHERRLDALRRAAGEVGRRTTREEARVAFDSAWGEHMACWRRGVATGAHEVALDALDGLGLHEPHPALEHLVREYQQASHSSRVLEVPDAAAALESLTRAGVRCALICDTGLTPGQVVRHHLEGLGLLEFLEVCIFSDEVGVPKPDARVFRAALEPFGVKPMDAVHVGDLRRTDVAGARGFGMATLRIRARHDDRSELPEADAVVDSHAELLQVLGLSSP